MWGDPVPGAGGVSSSFGDWDMDLFVSKRVPRRVLALVTALLNRRWGDQGYFVFIVFKVLSKSQGEGGMEWKYVTKLLWKLPFFPANYP